MATTLKDAEPRTVVADIVQFGEKLVIPTGVTLEEAKGLIERRQKYEAQKTVVSESFDAFPLDGAVMLDRVLNRRYGWSPAVPTPGFFTDNPPQLISVEVGPGQTKQVPWGRFLLPNVEGNINCGVNRTQDGRYCFAIHAEILRRDEEVVRKLFDDVRQEIKTNSIYRGKAIRINFLDDDGDALTNPQPKFLDTDSVDPGMLVLSQHLHRAVETNLFVPITRTRDCINNGIAVKRGVLLGGIFGTGKTMIAHVASKLAVESGITFLYIQKATELSHGIEFARQYQSPACVIFCEDIDREVAGERTEEMDEILNTIDGIDAKTSNIIVVLTTNAIKDINPAMLRPGRLDAVIDVTPPDAGAIERLIRVYAGSSLKAGTDLTKIGEVLSGNIPAVIAEVVKRAKLSQLGLQEEGTRVTQLSEEALLDSAQTIKAQVELLSPPVMKPADNITVALRQVFDDVLNGSSDTAGKMQKQIREIHDRLVS